MNQILAFDNAEGVDMPLINWTKLKKIHRQNPFLNVMQILEVSLNFIKLCFVCEISQVEEYSCLNDKRKGRRPRSKQLWNLNRVNTFTFRLKSPEKNIHFPFSLSSYGQNIGCLYIHGIHVTSNNFIKNKSLSFFFHIWK